MVARKHVKGWTPFLAAQHRLLWGVPKPSRVGFTSANTCIAVTPLPRSAPEPGKRAVCPGSVVWMDLDGVLRGSELGRLAALRPLLTVHSGGGLHCYWRLAEEVAPAEVESLNRASVRSSVAMP